MSARLGAYWRLMRFHRPIGIYLLLWPTLWALWLAAGGIPGLHVLAVFVLGTVLMRAAGCVINDFADRDFDPHVARTRDRPIAAGEVKPKDALLLFAGLCSTALLITLSLENTLVLLLAVPAAGLAALYPFTKRWISMPQAVLGLAFSWGIPMAFAAQTGTVNWAIVLPLMAANLCWVIAYDTFYAMADRADDLQVGVKSSAIWFGEYDRLITAVLQLLSLLLLAWVGRELGPVYFLGLGLASVAALYQQWMIRDREPAACFQAFLHNNWFGAAVFAGMALALGW